MTFGFAAHPEHDHAVERDQRDLADVEGAAHQPRRQPQLGRLQEDGEDHRKDAEGSNSGLSRPNLDPII